MLGVWNGEVSLPEAASCDFCVCVRFVIVVQTDKRPSGEASPRRVQASSDETILFEPELPEHSAPITVDTVLLRSRRIRTTPVRTIGEIHEFQVSFLVLPLFTLPLDNVDKITTPPVDQWSVQSQILCHELHHYRLVRG